MSEQNNQKQSNISIPIAIIVAGIIIALAFVYVNRSGPAEIPKANVVEEPKEESGTGGVKFTITRDSHVRGDFTAPITIVEFSDFECSFCARFHLTMLRVMENYPGQVRWVYKHFPLGFHPYAQPAAEASECASEQGQFWPYADQIFEKQAALSDALFPMIAQDLGLNLPQFNDCLDSGKYANKVKADYQEGIEAGVTGTPGSFINGQSVSGAVPYSTIENIIEELLKGGE